MKEAFDKEIDSLLRRHVGAGAEAHASDGEVAAQSSAHLDADELSAFAEGALPPPARLAAVSHLAGCDECRGLVVSLSRAAGMEGELEKRATSTQVESVKAARRRGWLSALFAPRVLRYAAPALVLCLVGVVSFIALRSRRESTQLAQRTSSGAPRRTDAARAEGGAANVQLSNANVTITSNANVSIPTSEEQSEETAARASGSAGRAGQPARGPNAEGEASGGAGEEPKRAEAQPPVAAPNETNAAAPPPAPRVSADAPAESAKAENKEKKDERQSTSAEEAAAANDQSQQAKQRTNQQRNLEPVAPDDSRNQTRAANNAPGNLSNSGARSGSLAATPREDRDRTERGGAGATASRRGRNEPRAKTEDDEVTRSEDSRSSAGETRTAAGHRFRREGGAWVDVNYKSTMTSTGVHRGTEGYRALVADIPEVGRVAEQLGGEVFVVVRGHAYHIR